MEQSEICRLVSEFLGEYNPQRFPLEFEVEAGRFVVDQYTGRPVALGVIIGDSGLDWTDDMVEAVLRHTASQVIVRQEANARLATYCGFMERLTKEPKSLRNLDTEVSMFLPR